MQEMAKVESERLSGLAFVVFSATMTIGRFLGDKLSKSFGSVNLILAGCLIAILGFVLVLNSTLVLSTVGFGLSGVGFSVIVPEIFRIAGKFKGIESARGISFVAGIGYAGFLLSPPVLGFLSNYKDLGLSFMALIGALIVAVLLVILLKNRITNLISDS